MTDRPERRVDLPSELAALRLSLNALAEAVATSFDEARITEAVVAEQRRGRLRFLVVVIAALVFVAAVVVGSASVSRSNNQIVRRIEDCSSKTGRCYQENQKLAGAAIQSILDGFKTQIDPHRLRNEAENLCQVEVFAVPPEHQGLTIDRAIDLYTGCVLRRSAGTQPPPLPPNPYTTSSTTTTTGEKKP
jgi:hypothetical protein